MPPTEIPEAAPRNQREGPSQPEPAGLRERREHEGPDEREANVPGQGSRGTRSPQFIDVHRLVSQRWCALDVVEGAWGVPGGTGALPEGPGARQHHWFVGTLLVTRYLLTLFAHVL